MSEAGFVGRYPTEELSRRVSDELDLNRAVQSYRMFFPSVSGHMIFKGRTRPPNSVETDAEFWRILHRIIDTEPALPLSGSPTANSPSSASEGRGVQPG
ncbi:hypothetical protein [Occultella kanbiaonis]|uniref:hypothetical protein n=1 Tax=Occultella kanbiaonis TaxID=2675754 RepID=UPI0013D85170|nr:hypothetical protein [Occultella kanbiaonis]